MSITASGAPPAATLPATRSAQPREAMLQLRASARPRRAGAASPPALRNTRSRVEQREAVARLRAGRGISAGASARAPRSASMPTSQARCAPSPVARRRGRRSAMVSISTTGLATSTPAMRRDAGEQRFVEAAARAAQLEVGLAVDGAHRGAELGERRGVDQVHRERQRDAEHHREQRGRVAPRVRTPLGQRQWRSRPSSGGSFIWRPRRMKLSRAPFAALCGAAGGTRRGLILGRSALARRLHCGARSCSRAAELAAFAALTALKQPRRVRGRSALRAPTASPALLVAPEIARAGCRLPLGGGGARAQARFTAHGTTRG